ncbi:hypothetical protein EMIT074MI3_12214 [Bacillus licheniformis]
MFERGMVKYSLYKVSAHSREAGSSPMKGGDAYDDIRNNLVNDCFWHVNCRVVEERKIDFP